MHSTTLFLTIEGKNFSPALVESKTNIIFEDKAEVGEIPANSQLGKPMNFGYGYLALNDGDLYSDKVLHIVEKNILLFEEAGGKLMYLDCFIEHDGQCVFEVSPIFMKKLGELNLPIIFSAYEKD